MNIRFHLISIALVTTAACKTMSSDNSEQKGALSSKQWQNMTQDSAGKVVPCKSKDQQCVMKDNQSGLEWTSIQAPVSWEKANKFCSSDLKWNGSSGWRLPSSDEVKAAAANNLYAVAKDNPNWIYERNASWDNSIGKSAMVFWGEQENTTFSAATVVYAHAATYRPTGKVFATSFACVRETKNTND